MPSTALRTARGFTLVELCLLLAIAGVLIAIAWPGFRTQLQRGHRADAVAALLRVQVAQESHRAHHGLYASRLAALTGANSTRSGQGLYDIELVAEGGDRYQARAIARAGSPAAGDARCAELSLRVNAGIAEFAPSAQCWNQ